LKNLFSIKGKVAIVTGGSRGIGAMIAQGFVENGVKTYITARKQNELEETANALNELCDGIGEGINECMGECIPMVADLSTLDGIKAFSKEINACEQKIDILVNNAGTVWGESFDTFPESGWDKVMDLNTKTPFFLTQQLLPLLQCSASKDAPARVINISSINGLNYPGVPTYSYTASKAAVIQLTRHLASDLVTQHINVNSIAPGFFLSKMTEYSVDGNQDEFAKKMVPMNRLGKAEDIAGTAIYLCATASSWMTGHTLVLDGGVIASGGYGS